MASRIEELLSALLNGDSTNMTPRSRMEAYLLAMINGSKDVPAPMTRVDAMLAALCQKGGSGGGGNAWDGKCVYEGSGEKKVRFGAYSFSSSQIPITEIDAQNCAGVGANAFYGNNNLQSVKLMGEEFNIEHDAFGDCQYLKTFYGNGVYGVDDFAFFGCVKLESVCILDSIRENGVSIGTGAFQYCTALKEIKGDIDIICENAFYECTSLEAIDLKYSEYIHAAAFCGCAKLTTVIVRTTKTVCTVELSAFADTPMMTGQGHIYVPASMYESYRAGYEAALNAAIGTGAFDILFRKIEDYPDICGG